MHLVLHALTPLLVDRLDEVVEMLLLGVLIDGGIQAEDLTLLHQALLGLKLRQPLVLVDGVLTLVGVVETEDGGVIVQGHSGSSSIILAEVSLKEVLLGVAELAPGSGLELITSVQHSGETVTATPHQGLHSILKRREIVRVRRLVGGWCLLLEGVYIDRARGGAGDFLGLHVHPVLKELESLVGCEGLLMLGLSCLLGPLSIEKLGVIDVWVLLLEFADLVIEYFFLLLSALGVERLVLRLVAIVNNVPSELSELLELLETGQLPIDVLLELAQLLPRLPQCLQLLYHLCLVPLLVCIVPHVEILVVDTRRLQHHHRLDPVQEDTLAEDEGEFGLIRVGEGDEGVT